ncbi:MAG: alpha-L-fucosidase [Reichenbachiella sp.]
MKEVTLIFGLTLLLLSAKAQKVYEPNWESLDQRACPTWYSEAKFGVFVHWGLYSVPGYTAKGTYAEWYGHALNADTSFMKGHQLKRHHAVSDFHERVYGSDVKYSDFREGFTCELFDPEEWASIFQRSGAKYVVLTSKHHDGYTLWPSQEASTSFGMEWNSVTSGPKRDLVGELTTAVRKTDVKMGLYYSLWDWFNPYWNEEMQLALKTGNMMDNHAEDKEVNADAGAVDQSRAALKKYVHEVMYPQFKELVTKYQPSLIFPDGDWWMSDDLWETRPLLSWLYNEAPNKDEVVINDRWGKVRGKHGGYFTTEYGSGFEGLDKPWEENRGIGMSFGVNRIENIDDYRTEKELIFMLVDLVSRGGNLLLNIGPNPDGTIPVIMQERLIQIGDWLEVNGEGIYGTKVWKKNYQWSDGIIPTFTKADYHSGFPVYEMTINPKPGNAHKEMWFTSKEDAVFAFLPQWPEDNILEVRDLDFEGKVSVDFLGTDKTWIVNIVEGEIIIDLSKVNISDLPCNHIYTFKLTEK